MTQFIRHYLLAVQFFTRIPVTGALADWVGYSTAMLRASAAHFPGVGWLVGGLVSALSALLLWALPYNTFAPLVVATLGTAFSILLTGAFHEDGLADVADGLGGSLDRNRALEIMKDSRVGAFGAIAIVSALLIKVALLAQLAALGYGLLWMGLFAGHVVSRTWPLLLIRLLPHVGDVAGSKSKPLADQITGGALLAALVWCASALGLVVWVQAQWGVVAAGHDASALLEPLAAALLASAMAFWILWRWFAKRLQGFTGDCLGTVQQVCELAFYLGLALGWPVQH
jgi:adenosylcobinamide-GDP ribazoletransferase